MKKIMFAAGAAAVASSAFAMPDVYDYKASVKHMYLKEVNVNIKDSFKGVVYQKYQKSASLKGYLIMDADGVTSPTIQGEESYPAADGQLAGFDYGRNRGFLVVLNSSAKEKDIKHAKILPAVLDAKWIDTAFTKKHLATSGLAEGTLYVGGDAVAPVREQIDLIGGKLKGRGAAPVAAAAATPGMVAAADYVWTSIYLFGQFNGPNWFKINKYDEHGALVAEVNPFGQFEYAWDQNLPILLRTDWAAVDDFGWAKVPNNYYHDTWMNGAGFGKWVSKVDVDDGEYCCGIVDEGFKDLRPRTLETLSGNLKGGLFLCTENGIDAKAALYKWFDDVAWEDQFNTARLEDGSGIFGKDSWQNDLWQDGFIEQETTDVISGTWSIKRNSKFFAERNAIARLLTDTETEELLAKGLDANRRHTALWAAIKGAALKLDKNVNLFDGTEIYSKTIANRFKVPMLTPQFIAYYRLAQAVTE